MKPTALLCNRLFNRAISTLLMLALSFSILYSQGTQKSGQSGKIPEKEQAISLLGELLYKPVINEEAINSLSGKYNRALDDFRSHPENPETHIWLGRRLAYMGEYIKAIRVFSDGIYYFPDDPRFYRHRGHRYITLRKLDLALADFQKATVLIKGKKDKIEPDGAPNAAGIPVSSINSNIWYHLGLTQYLMGDFKEAFESYLICYEESDNNDKKVSSGYWLYLIGRRLGKDQYCMDLLDKMDKDMKLIENFAYHEMLMFYKSGLSPEDYGLDIAEIMTDPTRAYGLGIWYFLEGNNESTKAIEVFNEIIELPSWPSFGYIAAEAELARLK